MSDLHDRNRKSRLEGAFPLTYLTDDLNAVRALLDYGEFPEPTTWWHVTDLASLPSVLATGLVPGCWRGGDTCAVFGIDALADVPGWRQYDPILEIRSAALPGQVKAWWVPPTAILGVWRSDTFIPAHQFRDT